MSGSRPIMDNWLLARTKTKYYGAYPAGFLERARMLLVGASKEASILHICGGKAREYNESGKKAGIPLWGFGKDDITLDIDQNLNPDILFDARELDKVEVQANEDGKLILCFNLTKLSTHPFLICKIPDAILIDRPYSIEDATHYACGPSVLPDLDKLLKDSLRIVKPGGLVGVIDYRWPQPGKLAQEVFVASVGTGRGGKARWFTVWKSKINDYPAQANQDENILEQAS